MTMTLAGLCAWMMLPALSPTGDGEGKDVRRVEKSEKSILVSKDKRLDVLSTAALTGGILQNRFPFIGPVLRARFDRSSKGYLGESAIFGVGEWDRRMSGDQLGEILRMTPGTDWEADGVSIEITGNRLVIVNDQDAIDKVRSAYERILAATAPRFEIRAVVYETEGQGGGGLPRKLDGKTTDALFAAIEQGKAGKVLYKGRAEVRAGDSVRMGQSTKQDFVGNVNVEIAQKATAGDPIIVPLDLDRSLTLRPLLAPDGNHVALIGMFQSRQLDGDVQSERVVAEGTQNIDQVRVDLRQRVFSMIVDDQAGYLMAPGGAMQPGLEILIQLRRLDARPQSVADLALIPTSLVASEALAPGRDLDPFPDSLGSKRINAKILTAYLEMLAPLEDGKSEMQSLPEFLWAKGPAVPDVRRIVRKMTADMSRSFVVEIRREIRPVEGESRAWSTYGQPVRIHSLAGRLGYAMTGYEQTYVGDYEVEVAQEAVIGKLQPAACFVGIQAWTAVIPSGQQAIVHLDLRDASLADWRRVPAPTDVVGDITIPKIEEAHLKRKLDLRIGQSRSLGEGARRIIDGVPHRTRITVKLIER